MTYRRKLREEMFLLDNSNIEAIVNKKELLAKDISAIRKMSEEDQRYLYGECDRWVLDNFELGLEIVAIMIPDQHENGIEHCYLRNAITGYCYDVRGEFGNDEDILRYTGVVYNQGNIEEFIFGNLDDFKKFMKWVEFEQIRDCFIR